MKLGAEPKKLVVLVVALLVAGYLYVSGSAPDGPPGGATRAPKAAAARPARPAPVKKVTRRSTRSARQFRPSLKPPREEDRPDPMTIDPTLRLDLLAKLQEVKVEKVSRSLFEFGRPPAPKAPEPKILPKKLAELRKKQREAAAKLAKRTTGKPPPPPIKLKFYGYISPVNSSGKKAFFLEGEDIFVAAEGDVIKKRYKIVKIGVNSAVVEDTENSHKQTLKLEEIRG